MTPNERGRIELLIAAGAFLVGFALLVVLNGCSSASKAELMDKSEFHYKLAANYYFDHNVVMATKEVYTALEQYPDNAKAHHLLGFICMGKKQYQEAIVHFTKALEIDPELLEARENLGAVYLSLGQWDDAIATLIPLKEEKLYTSPFLTHNNLGWAYYKKKQYNKAEQNFKMSVFLNPNFCLGYNNLGVLYKTMGKHESAMNNLNMAVKICKDYVEPYFHRGVVLDALGSPDLAKKSYSKCYDLAPDSIWGKRCMKKLGVASVM